MLEKLFWAATIAGVFLCLVYYAQWREARIEAFAQEYEECFWKEYGQHPSAWFSKHHEYPPCQQ